MENIDNKRLHRRLAIRTSVLCQTVGLSGGKSYTGRTIDVSTGGMLVEINDGRLNEGQLLSIEMDVPADSCLLENGNRFSGYARVCRIGIECSEELTGNTRAIALEFCDQSPLRT